MSDHDIRLATIREICNREGHGELLDLSTHADAPNRRLMCNRGCGTDIIELVTAMTHAQVVTMLERHNITGTVRFRGRVEVTSYV